METMLETLVADMRKGIVSFVYRKKDGTERHAIGTLYGVGHTIKGTGNTRECQWTLRYFDVEAHAWRSFIMDNLISVGESRKSTMEEHHNICLALVVKLKEKMQKEGSASFAYRKTDGSIRYAHGRLTEISGADDKYFVYFDTEKGEERKFRIDSFLGIGEPEEIDIDSITNYFAGSRFSGTESVDDGNLSHPARQSQDANSHTGERYNEFSDIRIKSILQKHGVDIEDTEDFLVVDLLPHLTKSQLKDLIIRATTRLAEL